MARMPTNLKGDPGRGQEAMSVLSSKFNLKYGVDTAMQLAHAEYADIRKLPFGIFTLDHMTKGGLPIGHMTRLWGPRSTLKSTLCLKVIANAQKTCRHCKAPIVVDPASSEVDCRCPNPRYQMANQKQYQWLNPQSAAAIVRGDLPESVAWTKKGKTKTPYVRCDRPSHIKKEDLLWGEGKKSVDVKFQETYRCEPMRTLIIDTERTVDRKWAVANGVDPALVLMVGSMYGEQAIDDLMEVLDVEEGMDIELDLLVIDSLTGLTPKDMLEKSMEDNPKVAALANLMKRFMQQLAHMRQKQGMMSLYTPTVLVTSQVSTHGVSSSIPAWLAPANGVYTEHALSLDLKMSRKGYHMVKDTQIADYGKFEFEIRKSKVGGSPEAKGEIVFQMVPIETTEGFVKQVGDSDDEKTVRAKAPGSGNRL